MTLRLAFSVIAHVDADIAIIDEALAVGTPFPKSACASCASSWTSIQSFCQPRHFRRQQPLQPRDPA